MEMSKMCEGVELGGVELGENVGTQRGRSIKTCRQTTMMSKVSQSMGF